MSIVVKNWDYLHTPFWHLTDTKYTTLVILPLQRHTIWSKYKLFGNIKILLKKKVYNNVSLFIQ